MLTSSPTCCVVHMVSSTSDLDLAMQANVAVVIAAFKDGLQSQGYDFAAAPDTPAARNINVVG